MRGDGAPAWAGQPRWHVLETGFAPAAQFLATWQAWRDDPHRPALLHQLATCPAPFGPGEVLRAAAADRQLQPLAQALADQCWGLTPGVHRLAFDGGRVLLTLCIGEAREHLLQQAARIDEVLLGDACPADVPLLKAIARLCRRGAVLDAAAGSDATAAALRQCGFDLEPAAAGPGLRGHYAPGWSLRHEAAAPVEPSQAVVVGAGLAGAAVAASLARRGWQVQVLDAAPQPAAGASGLPAGMLAPHTSPDDNLLSRLSRAGVRMTLQQCRELLAAGQDWSPSGVLEMRDDTRGLPDLGDAGLPWQRWAAGGRRAVWHEAAAWVRPAQLVQAWLATPGVAFRGGVRVDRVACDASGCSVLDAQGVTLARAPLVVVAAALDTGRIAGLPLRLNPVRGQVSAGLVPAGPALAATPVNGNGHLLPDVPLPQGRTWLSGATYGRADASTDVRPQDHAANLERLRGLVPDVAQRLAPDFDAGRVQAWTGVRCASADRRPLVGPLAPGLWASAALGSRGLTFAHLAAELLAARLHAEPLPLPQRLAAALDVARQVQPPG